MKKMKEEDTSSGTPSKKKKPEKKGRLSSMIESMQKRSSPVNAHKVATRYFEDFRKERSIPPSKETPQSEHKDTTAVTTGVTTAESSTLDTGVDTTVSTAVTTAVDKKNRKTSPAKAQNRAAGAKILDDSHTVSESKLYWSMREDCINKKSSELRFGLKELAEKTGLSDKTIRVAIHSLEDKLSIKVVEPSLGIYGRKIHVFEPEEVYENRKKAKLLIDSTTKKIIDSATAVSSTVDSAVTTAVKKKDGYKKEIIGLYKKYTGHDWDDRAEKFYSSIKHNLKPEIVEAALILGIMKDRRQKKHISDFKGLLKDLGDSLPKPYIEHLREAWKEFQAK